MSVLRLGAVSGFAVLIGGLWSPTAGQDWRASEIIELNRRIMHQQIIERDPGLFEEVPLDQFLVVAPGGRVENKVEAVEAAGEVLDPVPRNGHRARILLNTS